VTWPLSFRIATVLSESEIDELQSDLVNHYLPTNPRAVMIRLLKTVRELDRKLEKLEKRK
jgi:hypothetical protein